MLRRLLFALPTAFLFALLAAGVASAHDGDDHPVTAAATAEEQEELRGRIVELHGDPLTGAPRDRIFLLETASGERIRLEAGSRKLVPGQHVRVRGQRAGSSLIVAEGQAGVSIDSVVVQAIGPARTKNVAVIAFTFSDNTAQPWTKDQIAATFFGAGNSVRSYFGDASYGQVTVTGDVFGWYGIAATDDACNATSTWSTQAKAAATAAGVNLTAYQHIAFIFPRATSCGWAGLGYMPGPESWNNGNLSVRIAGHELAHNFGVHHAASLACTSGGVRVTLSDTCTESEYGDPFDIMGSSSRLTNHWHRWRLGYFTNDEVTTVTSASPGQYTVGVVSQATSVPKIVRVARGDGTFYYLEFRQPFGTFDNFAATDAAVNGVLVRIATDRTNTRPQLLDGTPATTTFSDAAFGSGKSLADTTRGITISVVSVSTSGAVVNVSFGPDVTAPSAPATISASTTETSVALSWGAATDAVGVAGYRVRRDGVQIADQPGRTFTDAGRTPGTAYTYSVVAYDAAGNVGAPATVSATTRAGDTTAPTAPTAFKATAKSQTTILLSWVASTDAVGVTGYRLTRDGAVIATTGSLTYTDSGLTAGRTYTYTVQARDVAGNWSAAATTSGSTKGRKSNLSGIVPSVITDANQTLPPRPK